MAGVSPAQLTFWSGDLRLKPTSEPVGGGIDSGPQLAGDAFSVPVLDTWICRESDDRPPSAWSHRIVIKNGGFLYHIPSDLRADTQRDRARIATVLAEPTPASAAPSS